MGFSELIAQKQSLAMLVIINLVRKQMELNLNYFDSESKKEAKSYKQTILLTILKDSTYFYLTINHKSSPS